MSGEWAARIVPEDNPVRAWAVCWAVKEELSKHKPGEPLKEVRGYLPPQVIPWDDSGVAMGYFNLWGRISDRQPQSGRIKFDFIEREPYYIAEFGYPKSLCVFDPALTIPLHHAFTMNMPPDGMRWSPARGDVAIDSFEWVDLVLLPRRGNPAGAITEDLTSGWQPARALHVRWSRFGLWRKPSIVRRVRWDDDSQPLDPGLVCYKLDGVADVGRAGRPVLIYHPSANPAEKQMDLKGIVRYLTKGIPWW